MRDPEYLLLDVRCLINTIKDPATRPLNGWFLLAHALANAVRDLDNTLSEGGELPEDWKVAQHQPKPQLGAKAACSAVLSIGDDDMDNIATMRCQLAAGHNGRHRELFFEGRAQVEWDEGA